MRGITELNVCVSRCIIVYYTDLQVQVNCKHKYKSDIWITQKAQNIHKNNNTIYNGGVLVNGIHGSKESVYKNVSGVYISEIHPSAH